MQINEKNLVLLLFDLIETGSRFVGSPKLGAQMIRNGTLLAERLFRTLNAR